jgi:hypothetical protein
MGLHGLGMLQSTWYCGISESQIRRSLVKLDQLILRRLTDGGAPKVSVNPVDLIDLEHLKLWPDKSEFEKKHCGTNAP